ncbi:hypothetical protein ACFWXH_15080 [Mesorhizobium sp. NPDC059054]|uniref:hypothetical protein n=1 Tax=Mesorhizobium sp. NPDC059054 TaxID=3346711 RepID=UPI0036A0D0B5
MGKAVVAWLVTGSIPLIFFVVGSTGKFDGGTTVAVAVIAILATFVTTISAVAFTLAGLWQAAMQEA